MILGYLRWQSDKKLLLKKIAKKFLLLIVDGMLLMLVVLFQFQSQQREKMFAFHFTIKRFD
jgi:hypothetical protein